jgi:hypothetical protein
MSAIAFAADDQQIKERAMPLLRVFDVEYTDGTHRTFSSHVYDTSGGHCVFMDEVRLPDGRDVLFFRRVVAAGQWREVTEITELMLPAGHTLQ